MPKTAQVAIESLLAVLGTQLKEHDLGIGDVELVASKMSKKLGQRIVQAIRELRQEVDELFRTMLTQQAERLCSIGAHCNARLDAEGYQELLYSVVEKFRYNFDHHNAGFGGVLLLDPRLTADFLAENTKIVPKAKPGEFEPRFRRSKKPSVEAIQWRLVNTFDPKGQARPFTLTEGLMLFIIGKPPLDSVELAGSINQFNCLPCVKKPNPPLVLERELGSNHTSCHTGYAVPIRAS